ncbi:MAG: hypothetical protein ABF504_15160, partial [Komagataeibacter saccharivorans]|uniref:hypothetical protein n=1 Tax=Komagataeibacter saccharivorans TaxID=265959 RepID=UPI0039ED3E4D
VYAIAGFPKSHRHPGQRTSLPVRANWIHGSDPGRRCPAHNRMMEKIFWYIRTGFHNHGRDNPQIYTKKPEHAVLQISMRFIRAYFRQRAGLYPASKVSLIIRRASVAACARYPENGF